MVLKEEIKALKDLRDHDINPLLEDSEEQKEEEQKEEETEYEQSEEGETDESELTTSSYSDNLDSPEAMPGDPEEGEDSDVHVDIEDLIAGPSPRRTSSRCSGRSQPSRSPSPAPRARSPTDSTVECRLVCGSQCQLPGSESDKHRASIPPILEFSDDPSSDSNCSIKIIWEKE